VYAKNAVQKMYKRVDFKNLCGKRIDSRKGAKKSKGIGFMARIITD
jgi:hypothetical protein